MREVACMFLSQLKLINEDGVVLTNVDFHEGVNFVVDAETSSHHNKVGKTTFLKLIDIAMGAKDRNGIYVDAGTNSTNTYLEQYIKTNRTTLCVILLDKFKKPSIKHKLQIELYKGGRYKIDGKRVSQVAYRHQLKKIIFNLEGKNPTFRELIKSFVRISMTGDTDAFLHNLPRSGTATFRAVYNFLFDISDPDIDQQRGDLAKELRSLNEGEKQFKHLQNIEDVNQVTQIISTLTNERDRIQKALNDIVSLKEFEAHREQWMKARVQYQELTKELSDLDYQLERNQAMQNQVRSDAHNDVDHDLTAKFFAEVQKLLPSIDKSYADLVKFNQQLYSNKLSYLKTIRQNIFAEKKIIQHQRSAITQDNDVLLTLVSSNKLDEYNRLSKNLASRNSDISRQKQLLDQLNKYRDEKDNLEEQIASLKDNTASDTTEIYSSKMAKFNRYFTDFAFQINEERPMLTYVPDVNKFPLSITDLSGTSTGTRKSLIAAFDLAYQYFAADEEKAIPKFVVHDLIETVEGSNVKNTVKIANASHLQYIVAVLKEKLDSSGFTEDEQSRYRVIQLSTGHRLFDE